jgi:hypothetical protein
MVCGDEFYRLKSLVFGKFPEPEGPASTCKKIWGGPFKPSFGLSGFAGECAGQVGIVSAFSAP